MKTFKKIILASIVLLLTISCKKEDLPKATQEGKNIMAAKVNGKVWIQKACSSCIEGGSGLRAYYSGNTLNIVAQGEQDGIVKTLEIQLFANKVSEYLSTTGSNYLEFGGGGKYYKTSTNATGVANVTKIDVGRKIISGTFSFKAENEDNPKDIITVTDGRFDVTYN